jgi:2-polyprenyl-6-methoxyphenol hydroxylase-like FAD-dependent oxidoreductase
VLDALLARGVPFDTLRMRRADGTLIAELATPRTGGEALPATMGALRSDIQDVLCDRVYAAGVNVRLGLTVRSITQDDHCARAEFTDGSTGAYDLVVGADGIRSAVRAMLGFTTVPQPSGMSIWRVVADRPAELDCAELYYDGPRYKAGYTPISADRCYAYLLDVDGSRSDFGDGPDWAVLRERSEGYGGTWGKIRSTLGPGSAVSHTRIEWLLLDDPWYRGRAIVIGDAAHACPPLIAQGAAMCAEDAVVLAELVTGDLPAGRALAAFMARRLPRVRIVVRNSLQLVRYEMGTEPHTDADVARAMSATLDFLAAAEA